MKELGKDKDQEELADEMAVRASLGAWLYSIREAAGLTREDVAGKDMDPAYIYKVEKGRSFIGASALAKILRRLGADPATAFSQRPFKIQPTNDELLALLKDRLNQPKHSDLGIPAAVLAALDESEKAALRDNVFTVVRATLSAFGKEGLLEPTRSADNKKRSV